MIEKLQTGAKNVVSESGKVLELKTSYSERKFYDGRRNTESVHDLKQSISHLHV